MKTRYEEFINLNDNVPFKLAINIKKTSIVCSVEANWHENIEIQFIEQGEGYVILDGETIDVKQNDIVVVNSNVIHYTGTKKELSYTCLIIDQKFCRESEIDPAILKFACYIKSDLLGKYLNELKKVYVNDRNKCRVAELKVIVLNLLIELRSKYATENLSENSKICDTVKNAIKYIRNNYAEKIVLSDISKSLYINKYTLMREFKKATKQTITQYINQYRCKMAANLIENGNSVFDSARKCGFNNPSFFSRTFKKYTGCLPSKVIVKQHQP